MTSQASAAFLKPPAYASYGTSSKTPRRRPKPQPLPQNQLQALPEQLQAMDFSMEHDSAKAMAGLEDGRTPSAPHLGNSTTNVQEDASSAGTTNSGPSMTWRSPLHGPQSVVSFDTQADLLAKSQEAVPLSGNEGSPWTQAPSWSQSPPPLPSRPPRYQRRRESRVFTSSHDSVIKETVVTPYKLDAPSFAPHLAGDGHADFFPWTGNHPEDVLSEQAIKQGFVDKTQLSQNEYQSARSALWPILKHKSGLQVLSSSLVSVLEQRQAKGRITAPSTFKPPPRVTLTDAKREAWLRDLASPAVPLRRLSRTVPHGIRGRVLLDHCLNKNIPVNRAVWLAKCVGANEMRAFKRKGVSGHLAKDGENKWIRDWTVFVEQFVEAVIGACGEEAWKAKTTYAIRLSKWLFAERLVDKEHFLDWVLGSLEAASAETLPIWILVTQHYWECLAQYRRSGRRLTSILMKNLSVVTESDCKDLLSPLIQLLLKLIASLIQSNPANFISPKMWATYGRTLMLNLDAYNATPLSDLSRIRCRIARLESESSTRNGHELSRLQLLRLFDTWQHSCSVEELSSRCLSVTNNHNLLMEKLLDWSTSPFRQGLSRTYLAIRLIRTWNELGVDTDGPTLEFLIRSKSLYSCKPNIYLLVSELVISGNFSCGRYIQWLISRGALNSYEIIGPNDPCEVRLLAELPLLGFGPHTLNVRRMLLARSGFATQDETETLIKAQTAVSELTADISVTEDTHQTGTDKISNLQAWLSGLSRTVKSDLSQWLCELVSLRVGKDDSNLGNAETAGSDKGVLLISVTHLATIIGVLESIQAFPALAHVLKLVSASDNPTILAYIADTLNYHRNIFGAIGVLDDCFMALLERYRTFISREVDDRSLLLSLINLASRLQAHEAIAEGLRKRLQHIDNKTTLAAYSPVSDNVMEGSPPTDSDFYDEVERLLSSGSSIDHNTFSRIFEKIVGQMELLWKISGVKIHQLSHLFVRLKAFEPKVFDDLMKRWIRSTLANENRVGLFQALPSLVISGCLCLSTITACTVEYLQATSESEAGTMRSDVAIATLQLLTPVDHHLSLESVQEQHRLRLLQNLYATDYAGDWLACLCCTLECISTSGSDTHLAYLDSFFSNEAVASILHRLVVHRVDELLKCVLLPSSYSTRSATGMIRCVLGPLIACGSVKGMATTPESQLERVVQLTSDISLPFSRIATILLFKGKYPATGAEASTKDHHLREAFLQALNSCKIFETPALIELVGSLEDDVAGQICKLAYTQLLSTMSLAKYKKERVLEEDNFQEVGSEIRNYLCIVQTTANSRTEDASEMSSSLVTKLEEYIEHVRSRSKESKMINAQRSKLSNWLSIVLQLILVYNERANCSKPCSAEQSRLFILLCVILLHEPLFLNPPLLEFIFDVAGELADNLTDEVRLKCFRFFRDRTHHPRIRYLLSSASEDDAANNALHITQPQPASITSTAATSISHPKTIPFHLRRWELLPDPASTLGENDTSLSLKLFNARRISHISSS